MAQTQQQDPVAVAPSERPEPPPAPSERHLGAQPGHAFQSILDNPVLVKEFRTRMRGTRAYWVLFAYTLLLAGVLAMMYFAYWANAVQQAEYPGGAATGAQDLGRAIYTFVFVAQAIMVALITPAITSGAVTIEREQQSYELLVTTPLRPVDIIRGKLTAAVAFVVLLLTVSLPLVSLSFLVGGVSPGEIVASYLMIALASFVYGTVGIFWSAALRTTAVATVVSYLTIFALFLVTLFPGLAFAGSRGGMPSPEFPFQSLNPVGAVFRGVQPEYFFGLQVPTWVSAALLNLLVGLVVFRAALGRLEHFEPPRPTLLRVYATLLWCVFATALLVPPATAAMKAMGTNVRVDEFVGPTLGALLVFLALVVPIYATGDVVVRVGESPVQRYLAGFLPHRMLRDELPNGVPLLYVWAAYFALLIPAVIWSGDKLRLFRPDHLFIPGVVLLACVLAGLIGLGHLFSVTLPSRWAACVMTYLAAVVVMALPYGTFIPWYQMSQRPTTPQPIWQLLYLVPFEGISQLMDPVGYWQRRPPLAFGEGVPVWLVTAVLYLAIGAASLAGAIARIASAGRSLGAPVPDAAGK